MIAIDPGRGKIADPAEPGRGRDLGAEAREHRIAGLLGRGGDEKMGGVPEKGGQFGERHGPGPPARGALGAEDAVARGPRGSGNRRAAITEAGNEQKTTIPRWWYHRLSLPETAWRG